MGEWSVRLADSTLTMDRRRVTWPDPDSIWPTQRPRPLRRAWPRAALAIPAFYAIAAKLARVRGLDPGHPRNLSKLTKTS
ncbi:MAG TPA: hypothetical protein DEQ40_08660 [Oxalobacteraceae bacterium]|nr:hypothetical protein [Oxalobacteraceae bacterium]